MKDIKEFAAELDKVIKASEANREPEKKSDSQERAERMIAAARFCMSERIPYVFDGTMNHRTASKRGAYDCSAFVQALYKSIGTTLPRSTRTQIKKGRSVSIDDIRIGDLIFYDTSGKKSQVNHVAMYIGNDEMIHTNSPADGINIQNIKTGKHAKWTIDVRRILPWT